MNYIQNEYDYIFKIVIVGDSCVGKSSLLLKYTDDQFCETFISTIGVDFRVKTLQLNEKLIKLQLWDTAGHERFRTITWSYYRGAHGFIIAFSLTDKNSFDNLSKWLDEIEKYGNEKKYKILVGTKTDMPQVIDQNKIDEFAKEHNLEYYATSAKTGVNIESVFTDITIHLREMNDNNVLKNDKKNKKTELNENIYNFDSNGKIIKNIKNIKKNTCCN